MTFENVLWIALGLGLGYYVTAHYRRTGKLI